MFLGSAKKNTIKLKAPLGFFEIGRLPGLVGWTWVHTSAHCLQTCTRSSAVSSMKVGARHKCVEFAIEILGFLQCYIRLYSKRMLFY